MKKRGGGRDALVKSALIEFEKYGYDGTNTNAIAKNAGYAPQTFYRHFSDKREIFLAVYREWAESELRDLLNTDSAELMASVLIRHHKSHAVFRRSLRYLSVHDDEVRKQRAQTRLSQMRLLEGRTHEREPARLLSVVLTLERLCDAIADKEYIACGITEKKARAEIVLLIEQNLRED
ncbi:MAG: helix-turn-helix domain-containing protein [Pseudomonadota bacterium]